jgi:hypothetical protein
MNWKIEFYKTEAGREPVSDFILSLTSENDQAQILRVLDLLSEHGINLCKYAPSEKAEAAS